MQKGVEKRVPREALPTGTGAGRAGHSPYARGFMCGQPGVEAGGMEAWEGRQVKRRRRRALVADRPEPSLDTLVATSKS